MKTQTLQATAFGNYSHNTITPLAKMGMLRIAHNMRTGYRKLALNLWKMCNILHILEQANNVTAAHRTYLNFEQKKGIKLTFCGSQMGDTMM
jgi:hypothetical protein